MFMKRHSTDQKYVMLARMKKLKYVLISIKLKHNNTYSLKYTFSQ